MKEKEKRGICRDMEKFSTCCPWPSCHCLAVIVCIALTVSPCRTSSVLNSGLFHDYCSYIVLQATSLVYTHSNPSLCSHSEKTKSSILFIISTNILLHCPCLAIFKNQTGLCWNHLYNYAVVPQLYFMRIFNCHNFGKKGF